MKINWRVRLRSKQFFTALTALIGLIITDAGIVDAGKYELYVQTILVILVAGGVIIDPTTDGVSDSKQALTYNRPKKDDEDQ